MIFQSLEPVDLATLTSVPYGRGRVPDLAPIVSRFSSAGLTPAEIGCGSCRSLPGEGLAVACTCPGRADQGEMNYRFSEIHCSVSLPSLSKSSPRASPTFGSMAGPMKGMFTEISLS